MLLAVLTWLTVFRATRLLVTDRVTERPRLALYRWACLRGERDWVKTAEDRTLVLSNIASGLTKTPLLAYYLTCPWCVSVWVGAAVIGLELLLLPSVPLPLLLWASSSAVTGLLANLED
jgi:hypothetical protein